MAEGKSRTTRVLTFAGLGVTVVAGAVGLAFTLNPELKPCLGGAEAQFTGAPVFPRTTSRDFDRHTGSTEAEVLADTSGDVGAEIRYSVQASSLRGEQIVVRSSLVDIERDRTLGRVQVSHNRQADRALVVRGCSEVIGQDLFVPTPHDPHRRYRVILELYRGVRFTSRLALTQTEIFSG